MTCNTDWRDLPRECLERVLELCGAYATCSAAQVCRAWRATTESEGLWELFVQNSRFRVNKNLRGAREICKFAWLAERGWQSGRGVYTPWAAQHSTWVTGLALDSQHVVSGSNDRSIVLWDRADGHWAHILNGHTGQVTCVGLDGRTVGSGSRDRTARLWDAGTEQQIHIFPSPRGEHINSIALGKQVLVGACGGGSMRVWCRRTGLEVRDLEGHVGAVYGVAIQDDTVVSASVDRTARVWDMRSGECVSSLETKHSDGLTCVALENDLMVTGDLEGLVRVWNIKTEKLEHVLEGHTDWVRSVSIADGRVCSTGRDGLLNVWNLKHRLHAMEGESNSETLLEDDENNITVNAQHHGQHFAVDTNGLEMRCVVMDENEIVAGGRDGIIHTWRFAPKDEKYRMMPSRLAPSMHYPLW
mmetsp:Transcript_22560/g.31410  ORF Transcript_22560/g.31410 Transcript_22560/m.31410 type:complete len:415 (-) Transcript_22560:57-1301(-)